MPLELRLMDDFKRFLEMPVILGYNSGKYDIPLIKKELYHQIFVKDAHPTDSRHLHIIRKGPSCYTSIQLTKMSLSASGGCYGFVLKDMREFTGPGGNLKTFMKAFQEQPTTTTTTTTTTGQQDDDDDDEKFYFPYEWLERYEQLKETQLPPYECFFSSLKDVNVLEEDMFLYKKKKNMLHLSDEEIVVESSTTYADRPNTGKENYDMIKRKWAEKGWNTMLDYLMYYNEMDVEPFLRAISVFLKALCPHKVNPLFESTSLPGVAKRILNQYMPPGSIYYLDRESIFKQMKKAEVGGQSIVMTRENPETHPYIVGYDACSLYLSSFAKKHFIGRPQVFVEEVGSPYLSYAYEYDAPPPRTTMNHQGSSSTSHSQQTNNRSYTDSIQLRRALSSRIANEYFDCIQKVDHPDELIVREWRIKLSTKERKYAAQRYEELNIPLAAPHSYRVDGLLHSQKKIYEFDGCYYHACDDNDACERLSNNATYKRTIFKNNLKDTLDNVNANNDDDNDDDDDDDDDRQRGKKKKKTIVVTLTPHQIRCIDMVRDETLTSNARNYQVIRMKECQWKRLRRGDSGSDDNSDDDSRKYKDVVNKITEFNNVMKQFPDGFALSGLIDREFLLDKIVKEEVDGLAFVDIYTPDHLKEKYEQFAPIIKHATVKMKDIGPYMQKVAKELQIDLGEGRKMVIDSYFGTRVGLTCESIRHLLSMGLKVTRIYQFIRYESFPMFAPFVDKITRLRMKGDEDPSKAIISTMAKLLGNSAFGSCITDVEKHRDVKIICRNNQSLSSGGNGGNNASSLTLLRREIATRKKFKGYEALSPDLLEVTYTKDAITFTQLRQISNVIFDGSKTTMRTFIDFCFNVLEKGTYQFMSTDTDSIYIAFKNGANFEANLNPNKRDYYEANKHRFFVTDKAKYGERTPGLFKIEATGSHMVALCAKSYVVYNDASKQVKFSCKGVQKDEC